MTPERWQHVKDLFQSAIEHAPSQRAEFLQLACAGDPELQSEVESLLAHDDSDLGSLDTPPEVAGELLINHQGESVVGQRIGPYQVVHVDGGDLITIERVDRVTGDQPRARYPSSPGARSRW